MQYDEEKLKEIEEFAELQFTPDEVAVIVGIDAGEFMAEMMDERGEIAVAYNRGRLRAEAEVRQSILRLAKQGSTPAQKQILDIIESNKDAIRNSYS
jgi:hypothetical protein